MGLFDIFGNQGSKKFYVRDFKNAYRLRPDVNPVRQQFQGYVNFILNRDFYSFLYNATGNQSDTTEFRTQISSMIRTADLPSVSFQTQIKNQYNRKKIVNTGLQYEPVNMTVFDTVGNEWLITLMKYFTYHYMDPRNKSSTPQDRDLLRTPAGQDELSRGDVSNPPTFMSDIFDSNWAGYNLNETPYFFERIDYILYHNNKGVQYTIFNPVLTGFKPTGLDYASSQPMEFALSFEYERFTIHNAVNFDLTAEDNDRFENASDMSGPAFEASGNPAIMVERELGILGSGNAERKRTGVPTPAPVTSEDEETPPEPTPLVSTYGNTTVSPNTGQEDTDDPLSDIVADVADAALTAAIHGGNITDTAISTAIGGLASVINQPPADPLDRGTLLLPGDEEGGEE